MKLPDNEFSINDKYVVKNKLKFADERREHRFCILYNLNNKIKIIL